MAVTLAVAGFLAAVAGFGFLDLLLAYAPGGMAEMSLIGLALGANAAFVATHHIARIALVVVAAPMAFKLIAKARGRADAG